MKATHTDYLHPRHLRVEGCRGQKLHDGVCQTDVLCVAPSSSLHSKLNRPNLKPWSKS